MAEPHEQQVLEELNKILGGEHTGVVAITEGESRELNIYRIRLTIPIGKVNYYVSTKFKLDVQDKIYDLRFKLIDKLLIKSPK